MRMTSCLLLAFSLMVLRAQPGWPVEPFDTALYAKLLTRYTRSVPDTAGTRVDYRGLSKSPDWPLLIESLEGSRPERLTTRSEKLAFWINAYNILAINLVVRHYPVSSIRDIGSLLVPVWRIDAGVVGGTSYTLDQVEHEILRPLKDPRIHAAIVCASVSCPSLRREPYSAATLDTQLDDSLRRWLSDPRKGMEIDRSSRVITLSAVFDWFAPDFARHGGVLEFLKPYLPEQERSWLAAHTQGVELRYFEYDWSLNDLEGNGREKATSAGQRPGQSRPPSGSASVSPAQPD